VCSSAVATSPANTVWKTLHGISHRMLEEKPDAVVDLLLDCITAHRNSAYFHFATATTPEGVHWYHRHSVYRGG
jgi:hypothetical protein